MNHYATGSRLVTTARKQAGLRSPDRQSRTASAWRHCIKGACGCGWPPRLSANEHLRLSDRHRSLPQPLHGFDQALVFNFVG